MASLSVMSEAQQKEINRGMKDLENLESKVEDLVKEVQVVKIEQARMATKSGSTSELIKTVGVPLLIAAVTSLVAFYLNKGG